MADMEIIDKLTWICIKDRKVLFVRSRGKDSFYTPGGKREKGESDEAALCREIKEEVGVKLIPESLKKVETFTAQAHGKAEGTLVQLTSYTGDFTGNLTPQSEIEELAWFNSNDKEKTSATGILVLNWLKEKNLID